jgi:hypothetical protein
LNATTYPTLLLFLWLQSSVLTLRSAMVIGSTAAYFWRKKAGANYAMYCYPIAAGFIAGEGLGGIVNAILTIAGVGGGVYGTAVCVHTQILYSRGT